MIKCLGTAHEVYPALSLKGSWVGEVLQSVTGRSQTMCDVTSTATDAQRKTKSLSVFTEARRNYDKKASQLRKGMVGQQSMTMRTTNN